MTSKKKYLIYSSSAKNGIYFVNFEPTYSNSWYYTTDPTKAFLFKKVSDVTAVMQKMHNIYMINANSTITLRHYLKKFGIKRITKEQAIIRSIIE